MTHTIKILARLNCGDVIARTSFHGVKRLSLSELEAHASAGATIIPARKAVA